MDICQGPRAAAARSGSQRRGARSAHSQCCPGEFNLSISSLSPQPHHPTIPLPSLPQGTCSVAWVGCIDGWESFCSAEEALCALAVLPWQVLSQHLSPPSPPPSPLHLTPPSHHSLAPSTSRGHALRHGWDGLMRREAAQCFCSLEEALGALAVLP